MNRLQANQSIRIDEELMSNNGLFRLRMSSSGGLTLYRTQVGIGHSMWTSPAAPHVGAYATMQPDGSFVTRAARGAPYWTTGTAGHPGASVVLQDDGNLVVVDSANNLLWQTHTGQNVLTPTIGYVGEGGYSYNETSESWKELCRAFPCFAALHWPGYNTEVIEDTIDGQQVVIQLWGGLCPQLLSAVGLHPLPGGVGAEVGVYVRIPGKIRPPSLSFLPPPPFLASILGTFTTAADHDLWWPIQKMESDPTIEFSFTNPVTGQTVFSAGPEKTYWLTKWMNQDSYQQYQKDQMTPANWTDYILDFTINGKRYRRWPNTGNVAPAAWLLLLS